MSKNNVPQFGGKDAEVEVAVRALHTMSGRERAKAFGVDPKMGVSTLIELLKGRIVDDLEVSDEIGHHLALAQRIWDHATKQPPGSEQRAIAGSEGFVKMVAMNKACAESADDMTRSPRATAMLINFQSYQAERASLPPVRERIWNAVQRAMGQW